MDLPFQHLRWLMVTNTANSVTCGASASSCTCCKKISPIVSLLLHMHRCTQALWLALCVYVCVSFSGCVESLHSYTALRRGFLRWLWKESSLSLALCGTPLVMQVRNASDIYTVPLWLQFSQCGNYYMFCLAAKNVIRCLLKVDPAHRITANELLDNPWISVRELNYSFLLFKWGHEYYRFRNRLISTLRFDGWFTAEPVRKKDLKERKSLFKGGHLNHCYTNKRLSDDAWCAPECSKGRRERGDERGAALLLSHFLSG